MFRSIKSLILVPTILFLSGMGVFSRFTAPEPLDTDRFDRLYETPLPPPNEALQVYHLGHSLVGHDMPAMLAQLVGPKHDYRSQTGWGTFLKAHWEHPNPEISGFEDGNSHAHYRDAREALTSGVYDAVVLTEAVEITASIKYMDSYKMLNNWVETAWANNPEARLYFYETWHHLDDEQGWLTRLDRDLDLYWIGQILSPALRLQGERLRPVYVIPGGQVMARVTREIEARGGVGPLQDRHSLFSDTIHFNDYGAYLIALTHYAVLYQKSPVGLPYQLNKADGTAATSPGPQAAALMQELVWEVVTTYAPTGVKG